MILLFFALITTTAIYGDRFSDQEFVQSVEYSILNPNTEIELYNNDSNETLNYSPNTRTSLGVAVNFEDFSLAGTFRDSSTQEDDDQISESRYNDFRLKTPFYRGILEAFYLKYKGFKIDQNEKNELLPITARTYGLNYTFFTNPQVNISQHMGNFQYDKKTEYGAFLSFGYAKNKVNSKTSMVPRGREDDFKNFVGLKSFEQDALSAIYGIAGSYSFYKFYVQGSIGIGINFSKVDYKGTDLESSSNSGPASKTHLNFGYQFKNTLVGFDTYLTSTSDRQGENELSIKRLDSNVYYHYFF